MKKDKETLLRTLDPIAYYVTQENKTERPYTSKYDQFYQEGIYVDVVSKEALFSSKDKYDAGCGWPSFSKPIAEVVKKKDKSLGMIRIEVRSKEADSHLGHVFDDGPKELGGLRYCINGAALEFIPKDKLKEKGYEKFLALFE